MKKKFFFLPLAAALFLTGCSSEEPETPTPVVGENGGYIAVNIVAPADMGGRGTVPRPEFGYDDNDYLLESENVVKKAYFFFFDENGAQTQIPQDVDLTFTKPTQPSTPAVERISNTVVMVAGATSPSQLLVVINPRAAIIDYTGMPISELLERTDLYYNDPTSENKKYFVMSNSTYLDAAGKITTATAITADNIAKTAEEAATKPAVEVYVERVLAKVITTPLPASFTVTDAKAAQTVDVSKLGENGQLAETTTLRPVIKGIEIANVANSSYLFKNIDGCSAWTGVWSTWNDETNKRCYWANSTPGLQVNNKSWTAVGETSPNNKNVFYIQENTTGQHSCVLLTAVIEKFNNETKEWSDFSFVRYLGSYYDFDGFLGQYVTILRDSQWRIRKRVSGGFVTETIPEEYLGWVHKEWEPSSGGVAVSGKAVDELLPYENTACINAVGKQAFKDNPDWVLGKGDGKSFNSYRDESSTIPYTVDDVNADLLKKQNRVMFWNKGMCYYYAPIQHWGPENTAFANGIVRNHIYDIAFGTLTGLGTPVVDPSLVIEPQKPVDELFYLQARVNILKWRVVKQTVNFDGEIGS